MEYKARVRFSKAAVKYTGLLNKGFSTVTKEVYVEAESALKAKLLIENEYGVGSCSQFPIPVDENN